MHPDIQNGTGPASALFLNTDVPKPRPTSSQALVKIHSFGLNRMDLMQREGKYNVPPQAGKTLGVEFSGWVEELGDDETGDFKVGDEVFGLAYGGMSCSLAGAVKMQMLTGDHRRICRVSCNINEDAHT